ncbi:protein angel homolog 2-like isoform X2 [Lineus longissimus]|uniref:protein angel homolog 2-like isoform X2 n=1 Tax=Lineus longissimus TaxID=88925 RepID=UPI00315C59E4
MNYLPWNLARAHLPLRQRLLCLTSWTKPTHQGGSGNPNVGILAGLQCSPHTFITVPSPGGLALLLTFKQNLMRPNSTILGLNRPKQSWQLHAPATMQRHKGQPCPRKDEDEEVASTSSHDKAPGKYTWLRRQWISIDSGREHPKGLDFSVMSYNVLAQSLLEEHRDMYHHCEPSFLNWEYRRKELIEEIKFFHPDVICMQEVQGDHYYDFFAPKMKKLGYQGVYKKRTHEKVDGCATFFNERKFALEIAMPVEYFNSEHPLLDRDNVGLVVLLKLVPRVRVSPRKKRHETVASTDARLCVANTHLLFNPRRGDVKLAQLCILLAEIDKIAAKPDFSGHHPVILCGDFNLCPLSPLYHFLVGKSLNLKDFSGKDLSGQKESQRGGHLPMSPNNLPPRLQISDQCQYMTEVAKRQRERNKATVQKILEQDRDGNMSELENPSKTSNNSDMHLNSFGSGVISNHLKLVSVFGHETQRANGRRYPVVSTKHGRSEANVDFMFYSVENKLQGVDHVSAFLKDKDGLLEEGTLKLLSKLDLYTPKEVRTIGGFPSKYYPSDHIPLMADFRLCF